MTGKIFRSIFAVASAVLLVSIIIITIVVYSQFSEMRRHQLSAQLVFASEGVEQNGSRYIEGLENSEYRITWIDSDGSVISDTEADPEYMENHMTRVEVAEAFDTGEGESSRYSDTLTEKTMYRAILLEDGTVLRVSASVRTGWTIVFDIFLVFASVFAIAVIISAFLARNMSKRIVKPLNEIDLDNPMNNEVYDELSPLLGRINKQQKQISRQIAELQSKTDEFEQVISAMKEGLVLIDWKGTVLSINKAAMRLFGITHRCNGENFLKLDHTLKLSRKVEAALQGNNSSFDMDKNGRKYHFNVTSISSENEPLGAVILAFDVTEQANAEQSRREFSANVSHELKTPLQSISGSAELLESGLVKPEDTQRFIGHIKNEATRLIALVNDIIHLSQLDENSAPANETVDLHALSLEAAEHLSAMAQKRSITLTVTGDKAEIIGVRQYVHEIIYNLCDNAIRYNNDGGSVTVDTGIEKGKPYVCVSDTGIGIPQEHHARIFERFYRVDKSHSKETGGTGLGLSIVKHAVSNLGGKISFSSAPGEGTSIKVTF